MTQPVLLLTLVTLLSDSDARCAPQPGRQAAAVRGEVRRGEPFARSTPGGWMVRLVPAPHGWLLEVAMEGRETEDLSRLTPPWHFAPNPRQIDGWHLRDRDNAGPNDGSVNAPQALREFIFSPRVGRGLEYAGSATRPDDVAAVRAFGRGWFHIDDYRLTAPRRGERAAFEWLRFSVCLTWPAGGSPRSSRRSDDVSARRGESVPGGPRRRSRCQWESRGRARQRGRNRGSVTSGATSS
jgi:hypothetical protein